MARFSIRLALLLMIALAMLTFSAMSPLTPSARAQSRSSAVLLFGIGMHIEPLGATLSSYVGGPGAGAVTGQNAQQSYNNSSLFNRHVEDLLRVASIIEAHYGKMTVQAQTPFTTAAARFGNSILSDLEERGHELALHFHEDAHLGSNSIHLPVETWCNVLKEEIELIHEAGVRAPIRYWSGGNLYSGLLDAASCAGLDVNSDYKNPKTQETNELVLGTNPWRPAGGPTETDMTKFATHDPNGPVIFLPEGRYNDEEFAQKKEIVAVSGDEAWFRVLEESLKRSLESADPTRVNVFHFTIHPGEFRGNMRDPFGVIEDFLTDVVDPLVASGQIRWATFSEMADAFAEWEKSNPGVDPRAGSTKSSSKQANKAFSSEACQSAGYITFAVNVHDFVHVDESADTLLRLIDIFERYGVRGDFYLTAPQAHSYQEQRPDVVERLEKSDMTISYHVRPPHPTYPGFDQRLQGLSTDALEQTLRDYETYRLDLSTGGLIRDEPGGYQYVSDLFGREPVVASVPNVRYRSVGLPIYKEMGARMTITYHETGTDPNEPFKYINGLLVRPSDFSVTRWTVSGQTEDAFWWNMLDKPVAAQYNPTARLQELLGRWQEKRLPFVTVLIHENNFYRSGGEAFTLIYYEDRDKTIPKQPPFDLNAPDISTPRTQKNQDDIWAAYEEIVKYASEHLRVAASEDIVALANGTLENPLTASACL